VSHGLVADDDAAGREHLLHRAQTQREAKIQPDPVPDDFRRKALAGVDGTCAVAHAADYRSGSAVGSRPVLTSPRGVLRMFSSNTVKIETARITRDRFFPSPLTTPVDHWLRACRAALRAAVWQSL
jgi:hypothetical protein